MKDKEYVKFGDIASGFEYGMNAAAIEYDGKNKYIRITDIEENSGLYDPSKFVSPDGVLEDKYLVRKNDILLARTGASVGKSYLNKEDINDLYFAGFLIRANVDKADPNYVYQFLQTELYNKFVIINSARSGQPGLNAEEYKNLEIPFYPLNQQQKIGKLLSSMDQLIELITKKINFIEKKLNSERQQLCGNNGNATLGNYFDYFNGKGYEDKIDNNSNSKIISLNSINLRGKLNNDLKSVNEDYDFLEKDDLVMILSDVAHGYFLGMTAVINEEKKYVLNQRVAGLRASQEISINYVRNCILAKQSYFKLMGQGSSQQNINKQDVLNFKFPHIPMEKQKLIASYLENLEYLIETQEEFLQNVKARKQYYLNKIFS